MDNTARLWTCDLVYPLRVFAGHTSSVNVSLVPSACGGDDLLSTHVQAVRFHPNGQYIATGSKDRTCRLWDIQTGLCVRLMRGCKVGLKRVGLIPSSSPSSSFLFFPAPISCSSTSFLFFYFFYLLIVLSPPRALFQVLHFLPMGSNSSVEVCRS